MIDLDKYSFDDSVSFVFDHDVLQEGEKEWYWQDEWEYESSDAPMLAHLTRLFRNPTFLLDA